MHAVGWNGGKKLVETFGFHIIYIRANSLNGKLILSYTSFDGFLSVRYWFIVPLSKEEQYYGSISIFLIVRIYETDLLVFLWNTHTNTAYIVRFIDSYFMSYLEGKNILYSLKKHKFGGDVCMSTQWSSKTTNNGRLSFNIFIYLLFLFVIYCRGFDKVNNF